MSTVTPILICIPYWQGDKDQAKELCKIIVGMQQHHVNNIAHFLLVARQDCANDRQMADILAQKFGVFQYRTPSPLRGWPAGPNGMFGTTMTHIALTSEKKYECVYWMEPDCIPICPNWFWSLVKEWRARHPEANIIGCRHDCHGDGTGDHITGCALYHPNIARIMPRITSCSNTAWDYALRNDIVKMGGHTKLIVNHYKGTNVDPSTFETMLKSGVVLWHGIKDDSLMNLVKNKWGIA